MRQLDEISNNHISIMCNPNCINTGEIDKNIPGRIILCNFISSNHEDILTTKKWNYSIDILVMDIALNGWLICSPTNLLVAKGFDINPLSVPLNPHRPL